MTNAIKLHSDFALSEAIGIFFDRLGAKLYPGEDGEPRYLIDAARASIPLHELSQVVAYLGCEMRGRDMRMTFQDYEDRFGHECKDHFGQEVARAFIAIRRFYRKDAADIVSAADMTNVIANLLKLHDSVRDERG